jgi:hypothetical protein
MIREKIATWRWSAMIATAMVIVVLLLLLGVPMRLPISS